MAEKEIIETFVELAEKVIETAKIYVKLYNAKAKDQITQNINWSNMQIVWQVHYESHRALNRLLFDIDQPYPFANVDIVLSYAKRVGDVSEIEKEVASTKELHQKLSECATDKTKWKELDKACRNGYQKIHDYFLKFHYVPTLDLAHLEEILGYVKKGVGLC